MKYGLHLGSCAQVPTHDLLRDVCQAAEETGYDSIVTGDHVLLPLDIRSHWPNEKFYGRRALEIYTDGPWLDCVAVMAFMAAVTDRVRIGSSVILVPHRNPFDMARKLATVDVLSEGRLVLGFGVGWMEEEMHMLGIPVKERGAITKEYVQAMKAVWTEDSPRLSGKYVQLDRDCNFLPRPVQTPHPPIWWGGESNKAMKRIAELGDGWNMSMLTLEQAKPLMEKLREYMEEAGRDFSELELTALVDLAILPPKELKKYKELGITTVYSMPPNLGGEDTESFLKQLETFAETVKEYGS